MPATPPPSQGELEFSRPLRPGRLSRARTHDVDETATPEERERVARLLGLQALPKLRIKGTLSAVGTGGWRFDGTLGASVVQSCVVTLAPVKARIDVALQRTWLPQDAMASAGREIDIDPEAIEEIDPLPESLDIGLLAIEELALALPPYPRAAGVPEAQATARPKGADPIEDREKPFAALAALRGKLDGGDQ